MDAVGRAFVHNPIVYIQLVMSIAIAAFCIAMLSKSGVTCDQESTYLPILTSTLAYWLPGPQLKDMIPAAARNNSNSSAAPPRASSVENAPTGAVNELQCILDSWKQQADRPDHVVVQMDGRDGSRLNIQMENAPSAGTQPQQLQPTSAHPASK